MVSLLGGDLEPTVHRHADFFFFLQYFVGENSSRHLKFFSQNQRENLDVGEFRDL